MINFVNKKREMFLFTTNQTSVSDAFFQKSLGIGKAESISLSLLT